MKTVHIKAQLQWVFSRDDESGHYVGSCEALGLCIDAPTYAELCDLIGHGLSEMLKMMAKDGSLPDFLLAHQWVTDGGIDNADDDLIFDIPFELVSGRGAHDQARHPH